MKKSGPRANRNSKEAIDVYPQLTDVPGSYVNWFVAMTLPDGIRLTMGEVLSKDETRARAHTSVFMTMSTAVKLYNSLHTTIKSAMGQTDNAPKA